MKFWWLNPSEKNIRIPLYLRKREGGWRRRNVFWKKSWILARRRWVRARRRRQLDVKLSSRHFSLSLPIVPSEKGIWTLFFCLKHLLPSWKRRYRRFHQVTLFELYRDLAAWFWCLHIYFPLLLCSDFSYCSSRLLYFTYIHQMTKIILTCLTNSTKLACITFFYLCYAQ